MAKLLIVDDERNIRRSLVSFFESLGHEVREAENGAQAVAMLAETQFDLVSDRLPDGRDDRAGTAARDQAARARVPGNSDDRLCDR